MKLEQFRFILVVLFQVGCQILCISSEAASFNHDSPSGGYSPFHGGYPEPQCHPVTSLEETITSKIPALPFDVHVTQDEEIHLDPTKPTIFVTHLDKSPHIPDSSYGPVLESSMSILLDQAQHENLDVVAMQYHRKTEPHEVFGGAREGSKFFHFDPHLATVWAQNTTGGNFGERLKVTSNRAVVTGGQFVYCASGTVNSLLKSWASQRIDGELNLFLPGMYDSAGNSRWPHSVRTKAEKVNRPFISAAENLDRFFENDSHRFGFLKSMAEEYLKNDSGVGFSIKDYEVIFNYRGLSQVIQQGEVTHKKSPHRIILNFVHPHDYSPQTLEKVVSGILK